MNQEAQQRIVSYFIEEAREHLNTIEQSLLSLRTNIHDSELINELFRAAHSIKGGAAMLGFTSIQRVSHRMEDFFKIFRERTVPVDQHLETLLLRGFDTLSMLLEQLEGGTLTDDGGTAALAEIEPVFQETETHISQLLGETPKAPPVVAAVAQKPTLATMMSQDVPALLKQMVEAVKQPGDVRPALLSLSDQLKAVGSQYALPAWETHLDVVKQAINTGTDLRNVVLVVVRSLKQASQDAIHGTPIQASSELQKLVAVPVVDPTQASLQEMDRLLRTMLDVFKTSPSTTRQKWQEQLVALRQLGSLHQWTEWIHLVEVVQHIVADLTQDVAIIVRPILKDLKQAHRQLTLGQASDIAPSADLLAFLPLPNISESFFDDLTEAPSAPVADDVPLSIDSGATAVHRLTDFLNEETSDGALEPPLGSVDFPLGAADVAQMEGDAADLGELLSTDWEDPDPSRYEIESYTDFPLAAAEDLEVGDVESSDEDPWALLPDGVMAGVSEGDDWTTDSGSFPASEPLAFDLDGGGFESTLADVNHEPEDEPLSLVEPLNEQSQLDEFQLPPLTGDAVDTAMGLDAVVVPTPLELGADDETAFENLFHNAEALADVEEGTPGFATVAEPDLAPPVVQAAEIDLAGLFAGMVDDTGAQAVIDDGMDELLTQWSPEESASSTETAVDQAWLNQRLAPEPTESDLGELLQDLAALEVTGSHELPLESLLDEPDLTAPNAEDLGSLDLPPLDEGDFADLFANHDTLDLPQEQDEVGVTDDWASLPGEGAILGLDESVVDVSANDMVAWPELETGQPSLDLGLDMAWDQAAAPVDDVPQISQEWPPLADEGEAELDITSGSLDLGEGFDLFVGEGDALEFPIAMGDDGAVVEAMTDADTFDLGSLDLGIEEPEISSPWGDEDLPPLTVTAADMSEAPVQELSVEDLFGDSAFLHFADDTPATDESGNETGGDSGIDSAFDLGVVWDESAGLAVEETDSASLSLGDFDLGADFAAPDQEEAVAAEQGGELTLDDLFIADEEDAAPTADYFLETEEEVPAPVAPSFSFETPDDDSLTVADLWGSPEEAGIDAGEPLALENLGEMWSDSLGQESFGDEDGPILESFLGDGSEDSNEAWGELLDNFGSSNGQVDLGPSEDFWGSEDSGVSPAESFTLGALDQLFDEGSGEESPSLPAEQPESQDTWEDDLDLGSLSLDGDFSSSVPAEEPDLAFNFADEMSAALGEETNDLDNLFAEEEAETPPAVGSEGAEDLDALFADTTEAEVAAVSGELNGFVELDEFDELSALFEDSPTALPSDSFEDLEAELFESTPTAGEARLDDLAALFDEPAPSQDMDELDSLFGSTAAADLEKELETLNTALDLPSSAVPTSPIESVPARSRAATPPPAAAKPSTRKPAASSASMRVEVKHLDFLNNLVGELVVNRNSLGQNQNRLRQFLENLLMRVQQLGELGQRMQDVYDRSLLEIALVSGRGTNGTGATATSVTGSSSLLSGSHSNRGLEALELDQFTVFHSLSQEIIELIVRVRESASDIQFVVDEVEQNSRQFGQITTQLQEGLNRARMVPFSQIADRLPRAVRDLSIKTGKQVNLVVDGRETLIDKAILEELYDPLTHLVNNALVHGIESPESRRKQGKNPEGKITVKTFYQGNQTLIVVADDGGGIPVEKVKAKAISKGLIQPNAELDEIYNVLFNPGFSGRDESEIDDLAGRGVGLDVVRRNINELRGSIQVDSNMGKGTTFTIRLPLTLSISKSMLCISDKALIAFPLDGVEEMMDVPKEEIEVDEKGRPTVQCSVGRLPFRPLSELLTYSHSHSRARSEVYSMTQDEGIVPIVVIQSGGQYAAIQVDNFVEEQEIVIKQLRGPAPKPLGIAGATVQGNGKVLPIADIIELVDLAYGRIRPRISWDHEDVVPVEVERQPTVLIVDDSITVRELLSMTFTKAGYRVEQARDGQDAWEKLRGGLPCDLVFCDIEMPRMDGLELLSRMREDDYLKDLPIAMLTSRGADKHRQLARERGANAYFTKPYLEEELITAAQQLMHGAVLLTA